MKGSSVKRSVDWWPVCLSDHVAFFSYRWFAWVVVALTLMLPNLPVATLPRDTGLLLLIGVINVVVTALAQGYVRIALQRPAILALDLVAGVAILWLSEGRTLPFLPYAFAALVLPALLFDWRGALLATVAFLGLDLVGLALINPEFGATLDGPALFARAITPIAFASTWVALGRVLPRSATSSGGRLAQTDAPALSQADHDAEPPPGAPLTLRLTDRVRPQTPPASAANLTAPGPLVLTRSTAEQRADPARRPLYDLPPTQGLSLTASLEQISAAAARQSGVEVRVTCIGAPQTLTQAQHSLLLRAAHEALINVQQHARAHSALLTLMFERTTVTLVIQDDGVGLLDGTYERPGLHALRAIRYRLAELDGQLAVVEPASGGLTVSATLPLE